jgi:hypothetical protein
METPVFLIVKVMLLVNPSCCPPKSPFCGVTDKIGVVSPVAGNAKFIDFTVACPIKVIRLNRTRYLFMATDFKYHPTWRPVGNPKVTENLRGFKQN